jgi:hypothetical protein
VERFGYADELETLNAINELIRTGTIELYDDETFRPGRQRLITRRDAERKIYGSLEELHQKLLTAQDYHDIRLTLEHHEGASDNWVAAAKRIGMRDADIDTSVS